MVWQILASVAIPGFVINRTVEGSTWILERIKNPRVTPLVVRWLPVMIGISTDDYRDKALGFLNSYKTNFSHFIDSQLVLENMLGADRLPLTLLVDAKGKVLAKYYGASEWDSPEKVKMIEKTFGIKL